MTQITDERLYYGEKRNRGLRSPVLFKSHGIAVPKKMPRQKEKSHNTPDLEATGREGGKATTVRLEEQRSPGAEKIPLRPG